MRKCQRHETFLSWRRIGCRNRIRMHAQPSQPSREAIVRDQLMLLGRTCRRPRSLEARQPNCRPCGGGNDAVAGVGRLPGIPGTSGGDQMRAKDRRIMPQSARWRSVRLTSLSHKDSMNPAARFPESQPILFAGASSNRANDDHRGLPPIISAAMTMTCDLPALSRKSHARLSRIAANYEAGILRSGQARSHFVCTPCLFARSPR
jgi:hypothetical protein